MAATGDEAVTLSQLKELISNISGSGGVSFDDIYPVGSIYLSMASTNPSTLFGGTWQKLEGRFLLTSDSDRSAGETGGSNDAVAIEHTHTGTAASAGSHDHNGYTYEAGSHSHSTGMSGSHKHSASMVSNGNHTHTVQNLVQVASSGSCATTSSNPYWYVKNTDGKTVAAGLHSHTVTVSSTSSNHSHTTNSTGSHEHEFSTKSAGAHTHSITVASSGVSGTGKNMPAYLVVNAWQRTA